MIALGAAIAVGCAKRSEHGATTPPPTETAPPPVETAPQPAEAAPIATGPDTDVEPEPAATQPDAAPGPAITAPEPTPQSLGSGRDPRKLASQQRPRTYLVAELQALERLYAATAKNAPDRPFLLRRLAENYIELEYLAERENQPTSSKVVAAARKKAIEHYRRVRDEYPTFPKLDEVLYYLGYEYEKGRDLANARAMYRQLVNQFPSSLYVTKIPTALAPR